MSDPHSNFPHQPSPVPEEHVESGSFLERYNIPPLFFLVASLAVIFILYQLVGGTITVLVAGSNVTRENVMLHRVLTLTGQVIFILVPTLVFARLMTSRLTVVFPWRMPRTGETIFAVLSLLFLQQLAQTYLFFQDRLPVPDELSRLLAPFREMIEQMVRMLVTAESVPELAFVVLVVAVVPAVTEEMLFRGLIQSGFERIFSPARAAIVSGVIFGAFHFNPFAIVPLMALGAFFGLLRMRSQSIVLPMTAHFLNNVLAVIVAHFKMDEELVLSGTRAVDAHLPVIFSQLALFLVLFLLSFSLYWRVTARLDQPKEG
jgi:membrane protease YdiL (CAAX protease family)